MLLFMCRVVTLWMSNFTHRVIATLVEFCGFFVLHLQKQKSMADWPTNDHSDCNNQIQKNALDRYSIKAR